MNAIPMHMSAGYLCHWQGSQWWSHRAQQEASPFYRRGKQGLSLTATYTATNLLLIILRTTDFREALKRFIGHKLGLGILWGNTTCFGVKDSWQTCSVMICRNKIYLILGDITSGRHYSFSKNTFQVPLLNSIRCAYLSASALGKSCILKRIPVSQMQE